MASFFIEISDADKGDTLDTEFISNIPNATLKLVEGKLKDTLFVEFPTSIKQNGNYYDIHISAKDRNCGFFNESSAIFTIFITDLDTPSFRVNPKITNCDDYSFELDVRDNHQFYAANWYINGVELKDSVKNIDHKFKTKGVHWIKAQYNACGLKKDSVKINIRNLNDLVIQNLNDTIVCSADSLLLKPKLKGGSGFWQLNSITKYGGLFVDTTKTRSVEGYFDNIRVSEVFPLTLSFIDSNGCTTDTTLNIDIRKSLEIDLQKDISICDGNAQFINLADSMGGEWFGTLINNNIVSLFSSDTGTFNFHYKHVAPKSCYHDSALLRFYHPPNIDISQYNRVCTTIDTLALYAKPKGGTWKGNSIFDNEYFSPSKASWGKHWLSYEYDSPNGCSDIDSIEMIVARTYPKAQVPDSMIVCENSGKIEIIGLPNSGKWKFNGQVSDSNYFRTNSNKFKPGNYSISFFNTDSNRCVGRAQTTLKINALPNISFYNDSIVKLNDTLEIINYETANH
ncbi:MAG: hypothetical protein ACPGLV_18290, partial [Bacteroidia bacterium]